MLNPRKFKPLKIKDKLLLGFHCEGCASCLNALDLKIQNKCLETAKPLLSDEDECSKGIARCDTHCTNTPGSYTCSCDQGYRLVNSYSCEDVDECMESTSPCPPLSTCDNTAGG